jgi:hypothetical protein
MRKSLAILLISVHLTGTTEIGQLLKLPRLIAHFFQHHRQDQSIGFIQFISMHYAGDDGTSADDDFDNQLPCHNVNHNTVTLAYSPMVDDINTTLNPVRKAIQFNRFPEKDITPEHVMLVLQPPRTA